MSSKHLDRFFLCLSNCLIFFACFHDLFIVKYRSDLHLISRWVFIGILIIYISFFVVTHLVPKFFSNVFLFLTSFLVSFCLSLSTLTLVTNTISSTNNLLIFNFLLVLSIICSFLSNFIRLIHHTTFHFIHYHELAELLGFSAGLYITSQPTALYYLLLSFFLLIITLRLRAFHSFLLLTLNIIYFYQYYNPYSFIGCWTFLIRLIGRPIIEIYFIPLTSLERWIFLLHFTSPYRTVFQRLMIIIHCLLSFYCVYIIGQTVRLHDEWFIIIPLFVLSFGIWILFRSLTFSLLWMLSKKLIDCYMTMIQANIDNEKHQISFIKLMASRGNELEKKNSNNAFAFLFFRYSIFRIDYLANLGLFNDLNMFHWIITL